MLPHLRNPTAVKSSHFIVAGQIHHTAHQLGQLHRLLTGIFQHHPPGHSILKNSEEKRQLRTGLNHNYLQCLRFSQCLGQAAFHRCNAIQDLIVVIAEICGNTAQLQRAFPVIPPARTAPSERQHIRATGGICFFQYHRGTPAKPGLAQKSFRIRSLHRFSEM